MAPDVSDRILVIEGDPRARAALRNRLEREGYRVETAATGREAVGRCPFGEYLAVLLDRLLPEASALASEIGQSAPDTEVILLPDPAGRGGAAPDPLSRRIDGPGLQGALARIARLKETEQRARQTERLAAVGRMVTVLAHEGRNALHQMSALHTLLASLVRDRPEAQDLLARTAKARQELTRLFEDLRCYAGTLSLRRESLDLGAVWRGVWADLGASREGRVAELVEESPGPGPSCHGDRFRLEQVFRNLFENALAACPDPVRVEVGWRQVDYRGQAALRLTVRDNGPGLTPEQRERAFEPFYTTKAKGTGLGLAILRDIVEAHGGEVTVGDGVGGAEFVLVLPREKA